MNQVPIIDYDNHPAFAGLAPPRSDSGALDAMVAEIEEVYEQIVGCANSTLQTRQQDFDATVGPKIDELVAAILRGPVLHADAADYIQTAIVRARHTLRTRLEAGGDSRNLTNSAAAVIDHSFLDGFDAIQRYGFCQVEAGRVLARRVWRSTVLERAILRRKAARHPNRHNAFPLHQSSPATRAVRVAVRELGILDIASAYMNQPMDLAYASLEMAHPGQNWYKDCYKDTGLPTAKTAYMHFDADRNMLKAMVYLSDVGPQNGPFGYVPGSHRWPRPTFACAVQNGFDQLQSRYSQMDDGGLDYEVGYYRPRFASRDDRRALLTLPQALRGSTHFGDDLLDGSDASEDLLRQEHVFADPAGTLVLFDGSQGIHRGSMVREGERWVLQLGLYPRPVAGTPVSDLKHGLRYLKHCVGNLLRLLGLR